MKLGRFKAPNRAGTGSNCRIQVEVHAVDWKGKGMLSKKEGICGARERALGAARDGFA